MPTLAEVVESLSAEDQQAVLVFIEYLRNGIPPKRSPDQASTFVAAAEDFIMQHPELLRRLAQ